MIYSDKPTLRPVPVTVGIVKPRTLDSLIDKYSMMPINAQSAQLALSERDAICCECDIKGFHTEEDLVMMDYLWHIRNEVVTYILASERAGRAVADAHRESQNYIRGLSAVEREALYARNNR
ncbi:hypothetical protein BL02_161 [Klebsiella phage BL02]|jgi:hypothetical protein|nr:hypothetical protein KP27_174 [Klebsiella phage KP27]YP_009194406.1 hypothetical protein CPT_Matisse162 [Klebsiella phage Matisse]MBG2194728.1 hypothetical protein [Klebsiella pneumoniae]URQ04414.1 hypothetical protein BL02_161 [Klebsiella phage BL02]WKN59671.1 hypothetical protein ayl_00088 [Klebsiella phage AYL]WMX18080.1 hypothetical protein [Klebsiella phage KpF2]CAK6605653.1 unknown function [Klebsiella phage vB_Ko_K41P2]